MITITPGESLSPKVPSQVAWDALNHIFRIACWKLKIIQLRPITIDVDDSPDFTEALSGSDAPTLKAQALTWVAQRVLDASRSLTRAQLRRLSLQIPKAQQGPSAYVFWKV